MMFLIDEKYQPWINKTRMNKPDIYYRREQHTNTNSTVQNDKLQHTILIS